MTSLRLTQDELYDILAERLPKDLEKLTVCKTRYLFLYEEQAHWYMMTQLRLGGLFEDLYLYQPEDESINLCFLIWLSGVAADQYGLRIHHNRVADTRGVYLGANWPRLAAVDAGLRYMFLDETPPKEWVSPIRRSLSL